MGASLLPPRGVFLPTWLIFDRELPAFLRDTLAQLMALGWASPGHELPPVSYDQLADLMGKSVSTIYSHFAVLRAYHTALRLRGAGNGLIIVTLAEWLYVTKPGGNPRIPEAPIKESDHDSDHEDEEDPDPHINDQNHVRRVNQKTPGSLGRSEDPVTTPPASGPPPKLPKAELPKELADDLIEAGIFSFLLPEVARSGWEKEDLAALLAWCEEDNRNKPGGLFMVRLRGGALVPERFYGKRCPVCRRVGKHAPDCRRGYGDGIA